MQRTATHFKTLATTSKSVGAHDPQIFAATLQLAAAHYNTLQHIATHSKTLHHTATHVLPAASLLGFMIRKSLLQHCNLLQRTTTHRSILQHTAPHCTTLATSSEFVGFHDQPIFPAPHCNSLQHTTTHCNIRQHTTPHCNTLATSSKFVGVHDPQIFALARFRVEICRHKRGSHRAPHLGFATHWC